MCKAKIISLKHATAHVCKIINSQWVQVPYKGLVNDIPHTMIKRSIGA